ncbi:DUF4349 domain-containing protein [Flavobacterium sp.]|uniref:DUF4349 domain-containing protein n=1 Tax=Flavobacterium sp. TaxID=239 RepID=UPI0011F50481|nr:DUF4349 domain-containing protein [Flavobacterium sp.]RZJ71916.1 MAG: DUF4349 domain-containing protein [Flavobacterium sp.]
MKTIFTLLLSACILVGCNKKSEPADKTYYASAETTEEVAAVEESAPAADMKVMASPLPPKVDRVDFVKPVVQIQQKIIRSADLKFQTDDLSKTSGRILSSLKKFGGFLQDDSETKENDQVSRTILVRVPAKNFDAFLTQISEGVAFFDEKNITSQNVTAEYIDNESRVKTQKALENRYLQLLGKANKVSEMLEIEEKLSQIREEIEAKQARLNYLQTQVDMSAFTITFYKNVPQKESASVSFGSKIWNAVVSGLNGLLDFLVGLLEMWPFIIILVALILFFRKRFRRRKTN